MNSCSIFWSGSDREQVSPINWQLLQFLCAVGSKVWSSPVGSVPCDILSQALSKGRLRAVPQFGTCSINACISLAHIAWLLGQPLDPRGLPESRPDRVDEFLQFDGVGVSKVVKMMSRTAINGTDHSVDDIGDKCIVSSGCAVSEHGHRLTLIDQTGELGDREVGAVSRSISREEAQAGDGQAVQVMKGEGQ